MWSATAFGSELDVGYVGSSNRLVISNRGKVLDDYGSIGRYLGSSNNSVLVTGPGSVWSNGVNTSPGELGVGRIGSGNSLIVSNQGVVVSTGNGVVGFDSDSSNNWALVTGPGSVWSNNTTVVGWNGAVNRLVIENQGKVVNSFAGYLGQYSSSRDNSVLVTGAGSVWSSDSSLVIGSEGARNSLVISNGGKVFNDYGEVGAYGNSSNNSVLVTGSGSVWSNRLDFYCGEGGSGNSLVISNGGKLFDDSGHIGPSSGCSNNTVRVVDGGVWQNRARLNVGEGGNSNVLTIAGGLVLATNVVIGNPNPIFPDTSSNNVVRVDSGSLIVTNAANDGALIMGLFGGKRELILNGGSVTVDSLIVTGGPNSVVTFNGGTLHTKATAVINGQQLVVGDGASAATYHLLGGVHSFNDGLRIRNNATLTGCGTINGAVVVDAGGTVVTDCGSLTFTGIVTNNGVMIATNGAVIESYGLVVNNGVINAIFGSTNFHAGVINNGTILDANIDSDGDGLSDIQEAIAGTNPTNAASALRITSITMEGDNVRITWSTAGGRTNVVQGGIGVIDGFGFPSDPSYTNEFFDISDLIIIQGEGDVQTNFVDDGVSWLGEYTNWPARYYRVRVAP